MGAQSHGINDPRINEEYTRRNEYIRGPRPLPVFPEGTHEGLPMEDRQIPEGNRSSASPVFMRPRIRVVGWSCADPGSLMLARFSWVRMASGRGSLLADPSLCDACELPLPDTTGGALPPSSR